MKYWSILLFVILLFACSGEQQQKNATAQKQTEYPDQESWDATIIITREGKTVGHLKAGHVQKFSKKQITLMDENILVDFFNEQGQHTTRLTAEGGKIFDNTQNMMAYGHVVVVSDSGLTLYTDTLNWNNKKQKLYSRIPIMLTTTENDTLYGDAFESDPSLENYVITNPHGKSSKTIELK